MIRVPGKLVVIGEYAVVDGAPAIVAAVDRGVSCVVLPGDGIEVPGDDDRFVRAALGWDGEGRWGTAPRALYRFEDWNPPRLKEKAGFGGSAAAVVAARRAAGLPVEDAFAIHAAVQGGGSGIDVFASIHGGIRRFPDGQQFSLPPILAIWSGQSAKTGPRVARYRAWEGRAEFVERSRALVLAFPQDPFRCLRESYLLLRRMAEAAGLDYDTPAHQRIAAIAQRFGGAAKPSGAGGGDIAIALLPDPEALRAMTTACEAEGLTPIAVRVCPPETG